MVNFFIHRPASCATQPSLLSGELRCCDAYEYPSAASCYIYAFTRLAGLFTSVRTTVSNNALAGLVPTMQPCCHRQGRERRCVKEGDSITVGSLQKIAAGAPVRPVAAKDHSE